MARKLGKARVGGFVLCEGNRGVLQVSEGEGAMNDVMAPV